MRKRKLWPFSLTLQGMAFKGKDRDKAEAYYYLDGEDLERRLCDINYTKGTKAHNQETINIDYKYGKLNAKEKEYVDLDFKYLSEKDKESTAYKLDKLDLDVKWNVVSQEDADYQRLKLNYPTKEDKHEKEYLLKQVELDKKYGHITETEYDKEVATINEEPWVGYHEYNVEQDDDGRIGVSFEMDWNSHFVKALRDEGYTGEDDELVVKRWYAEICRQAALDEGLAMDIFDDVNQPDKDISVVPKSAVTHKTDLGDGYTGHS